MPTLHGTELAYLSKNHANIYWYKNCIPSKNHANIYFDFRLTITKICDKIGAVFWHAFCIPSNFRAKQLGTLFA